MNNLLFLATDHGLITIERSRDRWIERFRALNEIHATCVVAHDGIALAGTTEGVFRSDDLGKTWQPRNEGLSIPHVRWLRFHHEDRDLVLAGTQPGGIFISHDSGDTWRECPEVASLRDEKGWYLPYAPEAGCVRGLAFWGDRAYAAVEQGGLLISDDRGEHWRLVNGSNGDPRVEEPTGNIHVDVHSVVVHPDGPDEVFAATAGGLYQSRDGGDTWVNLYPAYVRDMHVDRGLIQHIVHGPADGVARGGRIEETFDGGRTWLAASFGLETPWPRRMVERFARFDIFLLAVLSDGEVYAATPPKLVWERVLERFPHVKALSPMYS